MRNAVLFGLILLLVTAGCVTIDMGGGSSSKAPKVVKFDSKSQFYQRRRGGYTCLGGGKRLICQHRPGHPGGAFHRSR